MGGGGSVHAGLEDGEVCQESKRVEREQRGMCAKTWKAASFLGQKSFLKNAPWGKKKCPLAQGRATRYCWGMAELGAGVVLGRRAHPIEG